MSQRLRAHPLLSRAWSLVPNTHVKEPTTLSNSRYRKSTAFFLPHILWSLQMYIIKNKIKQRKASFPDYADSAAETLLSMSELCETIENKWFLLCIIYNFKFLTMVWNMRTDYVVDSISRTDSWRLLLLLNFFRTDHFLNFRILSYSEIWTISYSFLVLQQGNFWFLF